MDLLGAGWKAGLLQVDERVRDGAEFTRDSGGGFGERGHLPFLAYRR
jgi:hypothetical protein